MTPKDYLGRLKEAIQVTHDLDSIHVGTVATKVELPGVTLWEGEVEVFEVSHPKTTQCFAWGYDEGGRLECVAVLGIPPVNTAQMAVQAYLMSQLQAKKAQN